MHDHPFGHDRLECLASLALGAILFFTGAMLAYEGINKIYTKAPISTPGKNSIICSHCINYCKGRNVLVYKD